MCIYLLRSVCLCLWIGMRMRQRWKNRNKTPEIKVNKNQRSKMAASGGTSGGEGQAYPPGKTGSFFYHCPAVCFVCFDDLYGPFFGEWILCSPKAWMYLTFFYVV